MYRKCTCSVPGTRPGARLGAGSERASVSLSLSPLLGFACYCMRRAQKKVAEKKGYYITSWCTYRYRVQYVP